MNLVLYFWQFFRYTIRNENEKHIEHKHQSDPQPRREPLAHRQTDPLGVEHRRCCLAHHTRGQKKLKKVLDKS